MAYGHVFQQGVYPPPTGQVAPGAHQTLTTLCLLETVVAVQEVEEDLGELPLTGAVREEGVLVIVHLLNHPLLNHPLLNHPLLNHPPVVDWRRGARLGHGGERGRGREVQGHEH